MPSNNPAQNPAMMMAPNQPSTLRVGFPQPQPAMNNNPFATDPTTFTFGNNQRNSNNFPPFNPNNSPFSDNPFDSNNNRP